MKDFTLLMNEELSEALKGQARANKRSIMLINKAKDEIIIYGKMDSKKDSPMVEKKLTISELKANKELTDKDIKALESLHQKNQDNQKNSKVKNKPIRFDQMPSQRALGVLAKGHKISRWQRCLAFVKRHKKAILIITLVLVAAAITAGTFGVGGPITVAMALGAKMVAAKMAAIATGPVPSAWTTAASTVTSGGSAGASGFMGLSTAAKVGVGAGVVAVAEMERRTGLIRGAVKQGWKATKAVVGGTVKGASTLAGAVTDAPLYVAAGVATIATHVADAVSRRGKVSKNPSPLVLSSPPAISITNDLGSISPAATKNWTFNKIPAGAVAPITVAATVTGPKGRSYNVNKDGSLNSDASDTKTLVAMINHAYKSGNQTITITTADAKMKDKVANICQKLQEKFPSFGFTINGAITPPRDIGMKSKL